MLFLRNRKVIKLDPALNLAQMMVCLIKIQKVYQIIQFPIAIVTLIIRVIVHDIRFHVPACISDMVHHVPVIHTLTDCIPLFMCKFRNRLHIIDSQDNADIFILCLKQSVGKLHGTFRSQLKSVQHNDDWTDLR